MILVISRYGFEGWTWVLIASVPDLCILFTFKWSFLCMFEIKSFCFDVVICDLVHDVGPYMDYANCYQHLELFLELLEMLVQLQIAVSLE